MKINLYYVEGISRIDTPSFNTKTHIGTIQDQEEFFLTKLKKSIDMTFYPPYYRNSIKFDQDDLVITDNVNYLSLEYNGKTYYYFIDEINYTSTGIITLEVSMDTIQTFMFDIYISSGIIERKFINRWVGNNINRLYKRENVSSGLYTFELRNLVNSNQGWMIIGKIVNTPSPITINECGITGEKIFYPSEIVLYPYSQGSNIIYNNVTYTVVTNKFIAEQCSNPYLGDMYVIPFSPFKITDYNPSNGYINSDKFVGSIDNNQLVAIQPKASLINDWSTAIVSSDIKNYDYTFNFVKNTNKSIVFNSSFEPVLFDENYIKVIFGSRSSNTTVSLYMYDTPQLRCCYFANILEGSRFYFISSDFNNIKDDYRTLVADYAPIKLDLISDKYAQFNVTNKYRWLEAVGNAAVNGTLLFTNIGLKSAFASKDIAKIAATSLTPKRQQLSKKGKRAIESIERGLRDDIPGNIDKGVSNLFPLMSQAYEDYNKKHEPDNIKQASSNNDITSYSYQIIFEIQKVNDYEQCAQYYHRNGYLVDEYITQVSNIFNLIKNRYYYDMLKMSVPEVHLHNVIEDEDTVGLIEERFETGLRLWNVKNSDVIMGDFTYDNVELDYLS